MQTLACAMLLALLPHSQGLALGEDWIQWRGEAGDGIVRGAAVDLQIVVGAPSPIWRRPIGRGFSGVVTWNGNLYTADAQDGQEYLLAIRAETGEELWRAPIGPTLLPDIPGGGPRATPAATRNAVYMVGSYGDIVAFDRGDGRELWRFAIADHHAWRPAYGFSASPVPLDELILYPAGGERGWGVIALDRVTGTLRWNGADGPSSYATPTIGTLAGAQQVIALANHGIWGLDSGDGRVLWHFPWPARQFESAVSPILVDGDRVFVSAHGFGSLMLHIAQDTGAPDDPQATGAPDDPQAFVVRKVWENSALDNDYASSVYLDRAIFGSGSSFLFCLSPDDGSVHWRRRGFQLASVIAVDDLILTLDYACEVTLVRPSSLEYEEVASFTAFAFQRCLTAPTMVGDSLFLRNEKFLAAFKLGQDPRGNTP